MVENLSLPEKCDKCLSIIGVAQPGVQQAETEAPVVMGTIVSHVAQMGLPATANATEATTTTTNGRIEFLGLWKDTGSRAMPIKMGVAPHDPHQIKRGFDTLVREMRQKNVSSGIFAAQSYNQMHWSANPNEQGYKRHGFIGSRPDQATRSSWSQRTHRNEAMAFEGFDGVVNVLGGDWQNAVYKVSLGSGGAAQEIHEAPISLGMERGQPRTFDAYDTEGCYVGSCCLPIIWTAFCIKPTGPDTAQASGVSFLGNVLPIPWSFAMNRQGHRLGGLINPADPNSYANFDFSSSGNCICQKDHNETPLACHLQLCGASSCCCAPQGRITSHDMKGTWLICAPPCGWGIYAATAEANDPNRYHEKGCCFPCMVLPIPSDEVWTRHPNSNTFHKDKNRDDKVVFCCSWYGNEKGFIHKCKICPG